MVKSIVKKSLSTLVFITFTISCFAFLNRWFSLAEILVSFRPTYFYLSILLCTVTFMLRLRILSLVCLLLIVVNGFETIPYTPFFETASEESEADISLLFYNVDRQASRYAGVDHIIDVIVAYSPDVVVLAETPESVGVQVLQQTDYQWHFDHYLRLPPPYEVEPTVDGSMILSRFPLADSAVVQLGEGRPTLITHVMVFGEELRVLSPHPTNMLVSYPQRNSQLEALTEEIKKTQVPYALVGDLNVTMWSSWYKDFEDAGAENMRWGRGVMASWESPIPFIKAPLDHVLVGNGVGVISAELLPITVSDHAPILVTLELP